MVISASTNDLMGISVQKLSIRKELHPSQKAAADRSRPSAVIAFPTSSSLPQAGWDFVLQQTLAEDGILDVLLVVEHEAGNDGAEQCRGWHFDAGG